jgi:hypothetical protein
MVFDRYSYIYIYIYTHITSIHIYIYSIHGVKLFNPTIVGHAHLPSFAPRSPWRRRAAPPIRPCPAGILSFCIDFPQTHLIHTVFLMFLLMYIYTLMYVYIIIYIYLYTTLYIIYIYICKYSCIYQKP